MKTIKNIFLPLFVSGCLLLIVSSCNKKDPNSPGFEFMPDMYRSPSIEVYSSASTYFADSTAMRKPASGTIARGKMPYMIANDKDGYEKAGTELKNPIAFSEQVVGEGQSLYGKYCIHCHGAEGKGDGAVGAKLPGAPPSFSGALMTLPEGKIFHSITYGKGLMGPHGSMLSQEERWKLVHYVQKLQKLGMPASVMASADSTKMAKK